MFSLIFEKFPFKRTKVMIYKTLQIVRTAQKKKKTQKLKLGPMDPDGILMVKSH